MARSRDERENRRTGREAGYTTQTNQQNPNGQQYQQNPNGQQQYYQQNPNGQQQYYQQNPNGQQYYQQNPNGQQQYYQQNPNGHQQYYQQNPNGQQQYYRQNPNGQQQYYQQNPYGQQRYYQNARGQQGYGAPYQAEMAAASDKKKKKKKKRKVLFVFEILLLLVLAVGLYAAATLSKVQRVQLKDDEIKQKVQEQLPEYTAKALQGYWNIALYGVDSRDNLDVGQSDTIMVCSINKDTKEVKLASVYRDTYLETGDGSYNFRKATDVYGIYGVERSIQILKENLDLDISDFLTVNMNVVAEVVNDIGGVDIDVREDEINFLNGYQNEGSEITGLEIVPVTSAGMQTLNGLQALSYCRIRYTAAIDSEHEGLDYERTYRQRKVLEQILEKVKKMDPITITNIINDVMGQVSTSLSTTEILNLAKDVASYSLTDTTGFPFEKQTADVDAGDCVIPVNLAQNVTELHQFLFANEEYTPSDTVQGISDEIAYRTGIS